MLTLSAVLLLVGAALAVIALVVLHLLPTGVRPLRDPVSQYGISRFRWGYGIAAWGAAVAGAGAAMLLSTVQGWGAVGMLALFAVARAVIAFVPMDAHGAARTPTGRAHYVLAVIAFATVTIAAFIGAGPLRFAGHDGLGMASTLLGIVMAIGCAGVIVLARISRPSVFGLFERLIYVGFLAWFLVLGVGAIAG